MRHIAVGVLPHRLGKEHGAGFGDVRRAGFDIASACVCACVCEGRVMETEAAGEKERVEKRGKGSSDCRVRLWVGRRRADEAH